MPAHRNLDSRFLIPIAQSQSKPVGSVMLIMDFEMAMTRLTTTKVQSYSFNEDTRTHIVRTKNSIYVMQVIFVDRITGDGVLLNITDVLFFTSFLSCVPISLIVMP